MKVKNKTANKAATTAICPATSPSSFAISKIAAPIAPGPAIRGVASGNTEISFFDVASRSSSSVVEMPPEERANTISMPIRRSKIPPAALKAARDMPRPANSISPTRAKITKIMAATSVPRIAINSLCCDVSPAVNAANTAATSRGPMVAKNVARATPADSSIGVERFGCHLAMIISG